MTIDEAIKLLDTHQCDMLDTPAIDLRNAIKLGIEALKQIKECRECSDWCEKLTLSGETEEVK